MRRFRICLVALALAACTSTKGVSISEERLAELKKNKATVQAVIAELGQPTGSQLMHSGERVLTYSQDKVHIDPKAAIPVVGLFMNDSGFSNSAVSLVFAANGALMSYTTQTMNFGGGGTTFTPGSN